MRNDKMVFGIDRGLHIIANDPGISPACRHRARIRIAERDLLVLALDQLGIDGIEALDLFLQLREFVLEPRGSGLRHRVPLPVRSFEL